ncbi:MAG TPA: aspartyl protease family protein [Stenomitos sp.]
MKLRVYLFLIVTGLSLALGAFIRHTLNQRTQATLVWQGDTATVPFEDYGGHLYIQASANGTPAENWIIDSGAADVFISQRKAAALNLQPQDQVSIPGESHSVSTHYVPRLAVQVGPIALQDQESVAIPASETQGLEQYFGRSLTGILGYELFEQLVVELNYSQHRLRLHRPSTYRYQGTGIRLPLLIQNKRPYVEASILPYGSPPLQGRFMIDLGSNTSVSIKASCGLERRLLAAAPRTLQRQLTTIQGSTPVVLGRLQKFQIGEIAIRQPVAVVSATSKGECDRITGNIGNGILRQFNVILNYPQKQLILEPLRQPTEESANSYDLSGIALQAKGAQLNTYRIGNVFPHTPAAQAGLQIGDIVTQVNGKPSQKLTLVEVRQQLSQPNTTARLTIRRGTRKIDTRLNLKPLL